MKYWSVFADKDGYGIHCVEVPLWTLVVEDVADFMFGTILRHRLCCRIPSFAWRIPIGRPIYDSSEGMVDERGRPWIVNSLASWLYDMNTDLISISWRREKDFGRYRISMDEARKIAPDFVDELEE